MPNLLPKTLSQTKILAPRAKLIPLQFPSIFRTIPESTLAFTKFLPHIKILTVCLVSFYLLAATISQVRQFQNNREYLRKITLQRSSIQKEINYWQKIANEFKNYPDVYLKIATLEYTLGNTQAAKNYLDKALSINPQLETGRVLGEKISR